MAEDPEVDHEGMELGPDFDAGPFAAAPVEPWEEPPGVPPPPRTRAEYAKLAADLLWKYRRADAPLIVEGGS